MFGYYWFNSIDISLSGISCGLSSSSSISGFICFGLSGVNARIKVFVIRKVGNLSRNNNIDGLGTLAFGVLLNFKNSAIYLDVINSIRLATNGSDFFNLIF